MHAEQHDIEPSHSRFWPAGLPRTLCWPQTPLADNLSASTQRDPHKAAIVFYDSIVSYAQLDREVDAMAGYLQRACALAVGERVLLYSQNCPQFVIAYYAILRAGGMVVPANPMYVEREIEHIVHDSGTRIALIGQELHDRVRGLSEAGALEHVVAYAYSDYLSADTDLALPADVAAPRRSLAPGKAVAWADALAAGHAPQAVDIGPESLCVLGYTSGTTGQPKGCVHTHASVGAPVVGSATWRGGQANDLSLSVAPLFHFLGMQGGMNLPLYVGSTIVLMQRWNRDVALTLMQRYGVTWWSGPPAMITEFFANPAVDDHDLSALKLLMGGGAAMPEAVARRLHDDFGIVFNESYGMTETAAFILANPVERGKRQCLGIPTFDVDARVIDPTTLETVAPGAPGELVLNGPQVMREYWQLPGANAEVFVEIQGKRFLRTGDLVSVDAEGYFFMVDRLKRMINASGFKVWPAEVESILYGHPAVAEACVVGVADARRGETAMAVLVLRPDAVGSTSAAAVREWCRGEMAAYKIPTIVEFVEALPRSGTGKIQWRQLQDEAAARMTSLSKE